MRGEVCVSVPTDDGRSVKLGHFGDARYYFHYVYRGGRWELARRVENPFTGRHHHEHHHEEHGHHGHGHGHGEGGKRRQILRLQEGCTVVVSVAFGPGGREFMEKQGLRVVMVKPRTSIEEALRRVEEELGLRGAASSP